MASLINKNNVLTKSIYQVASMLSLATLAACLQGEAGTGKSASAPGAAPEAGEELPSFDLSSSGSNLSISPSGVQSVTQGSTQSFTLNPTNNFTVSTKVGGTCPAGSWTGSTYTTCSVTEACSVTFSASLVMHLCGSYWNDVGNWYFDAGCSSAANRIPANGDSVVNQNGFSDIPPSVVVLAAYYGSGGDCSGGSSNGGTDNINIADGGTLSVSGGCWHGTNEGSITADFNSVYNWGQISGVVNFYETGAWGGNGSSVSGTVTFHGNSVNENLATGEVTFNDASTNGGPTGQGIVQGNATFNGSSANGGASTGDISGANVVFNNTSTNNANGSITVSNNVSFNNSSSNLGTVTGSVVCTTDSGNCTAQ